MKKDSKIQTNFQLKKIENKEEMLKNPSTKPKKMTKVTKQKEHIYGNEDKMNDPNHEIQMVHEKRVNQITLLLQSTDSEDCPNKLSQLNQNMILNELWHMFPTNPSSCLNILFEMRQKNSHLFENKMQIVWPSNQVLKLFHENCGQSKSKRSINFKSLQTILEIKFETAPRSIIIAAILMHYWKQVSHLNFSSVEQFFKDLHESLQSNIIVLYKTHSICLLKHFRTMMLEISKKQIGIHSVSWIIISFMISFNQFIILRQTQDQKYQSLDKYKFTVQLVIEVVSRVSYYKNLPVTFQKHKYITFLQEIINSEDGKNHKLNLPIYDFIFLTIVSPQAEFYQQIMEIVTKSLAEKFLKKQFGYQQLIQNKAMKSSIIMCGCIFLMKPLCIPQKSHLQIDLIKFIIFFKQKDFIQKILAKFHKLNSDEIIPQQIRAMFTMAQECMCRKKRQHFVDCLMSNHECMKKIKNHFDYNHLSSEDQQKFFGLNQENFYYQKSQRLGYSLFFSIEIELSRYPLQIYMDLYISGINIFSSQSFFKSILQRQNPKVITDFMIQLAVKFLQPRNLFSEKMFICLFFQYCFKLGNSDYIGIYLMKIEIESILRINKLLLYQSYNESYRKNLVPQQLSVQKRFSKLTSAGFAQKTFFIDTYFTDFKQLYKWHELLEIKNDDYIVIKIFYHTLSSQFLSNNQGRNKMQKMITFIISKLQLAIDSDRLEEINAMMHLIVVLFYAQAASQQGLKKVKNDLDPLIAKILDIIFNCCNDIIKMLEKLTNFQKIMTMQQTITMNRSLEENLVRENAKLLLKKKQMHTQLLDNIVRFIEIIPNITELLSSKICPDMINSTLKNLSKETSLSVYGSIRQVSQVSSQKVFENQVVLLLEKSQIKKLCDFMLLRELAYNYCQTQFNTFEYDRIIKPEEICEICIKILKLEIQIGKEKIILQQKLFCLQILAQFKKYVKQNENYGKQNQNYCQKNSFICYFKKVFGSEIRHILGQIIYLNPKILAKYETSLSGNIRYMVLDWLFEEYQTQYEILPSLETWFVVYQLALSNSFQIRLFLCNALAYSLRRKKFNNFQKNQLKVITAFTFMYIYSNNGQVRDLSKFLIENMRENPDFKNVSLIVILNLISFYMNFCCNNLENRLYIDISNLIQEVNKIWKVKGEDEYIIYSMGEQIKNKAHFRFKIVLSSHQNFNSTSILLKQYSNYDVQNQFCMTLKEYKKNQQDFNKIIQRYGILMFEKFQNIIKKKARGKRVLKGKNKQDLQINWNLFQKMGIFELVS